MDRDRDGYKDMDMDKGREVRIADEHHVMTQKKKKKEKEKETEGKENLHHLPQNLPVISSQRTSSSLGDHIVVDCIHDLFITASVMANRDIDLDLER